MDRYIDRVIPATEADELVALAAMLYGFPTRQYMHRMDSLAVFPGYVDLSVEEAAAVFVHHERLKHFYVCGVHPNTPYHTPFTKERLGNAPFRVPINRSIVTQLNALHTRDQTEWLVSEIQSRGDRMVAVMVYPFHLLRAFSTLVHTIQTRNHYDTMVFPIPTPIDPRRTFPEINADAWELMPGEIRRIHCYRTHNWVASFERMQAYIKKMWEAIQ